MAKPSDHPGFRALLSEWNRKLEESGLQDAEGMVRGELELKRSGTVRRFESMDEIRRDLKASYFSLVAERVAKTVFEDETEEQILTLYSQGVSQADIQRRLWVKGNRRRVWGPVYKWLRQWGLKK